ncbi:terminase small subunit [Rhizobium rhizogenes]|uniref:terminase small subunit n=1 Tax=Rhizobium rhizogenes TaxID=359 RepID=UPI0015747083|nr:terminase small subunit [Rhizobium rhizogenes]NTG07238.1 terminase small subunit [Rhizobium rhizogenes]
MGVLKNARHEKFAQLRAQGKTQDEAYELAGFKPSRHHASRLATKGNIQARVAEIQGRAAERAAVTIHSLTDELEEARGIAIAEKQTSAAVAATLGKAKLHGLLIEKKQHTGANGGPIQTVDLSKLSDDEFNRLESILGSLAFDGGDQSGEGEEDGAD